MIGVVSLSDALAKATEAGVDLVEISPKADPPVARVIDYGKMLYAEKKKAQAQKIATKKLEQKGIRLTFRMAEGDQDRQAAHAQEFLQAGHPLRVQLRLRGREKAHMDLAMKKLWGFLNDLEEYGSVETRPKGGGNQIIAVMKPLMKKKSEKPPEKKKESPKKEVGE